MAKLLFDPVQLEKELTMAKKATATADKATAEKVNMSAEIKAALGTLGMDAKADDVAAAIQAKHPNNSFVAEKVANKNFGTIVSGIKGKLRGGAAGGSKSKATAEKVASLKEYVNFVTDDKGKPKTAFSLQEAVEIVKKFPNPEPLESKWNKVVEIVGAAKAKEIVELLG